MKTELVGIIQARQPSRWFRADQIGLAGLVSGALVVVVSASQAALGAQSEFFCRDAHHCKIPYNKSGAIDGLEVCFRDSEAKEKVAETNWKNGHRHGLQRCLEGSKLRFTVSYTNGVLSGEARQHQYDSAGDRISFLKNGFAHGPRFRVKDEQITAIDGCWVDGVFQTTDVVSCLELNSSSRGWSKKITAWLESQQKMRFAAMNGRREVKSSSGAVLETYTLVAGRMDGVFESRYENGKKKRAGTYKAGERVGEWITYFEDGAIQSRQNYVSGDLVREEIRRQNGSLETNRELTWSNGRVTRTCEQRHWENGKRRESICWVGDGGWWDRRDGPYMVWHENGSVFIQGQYQEGERDGLWKTLPEDGSDQVESQSHYKKGTLIRTQVRDGQFINETEYHPDGSVKSQRRISAHAI